MILSRYRSLPLSLMLALAACEGAEEPRMEGQEATPQQNSPEARSAATPPAVAPAAGTSLHLIRVQSEPKLRATQALVESLGGRITMLYGDELLAAQLSSAAAQALATRSNTEVFEGVVDPEVVADLSPGHTYFVHAYNQFVDGRIEQRLAAEAGELDTQEGPSQQALALARATSASADEDDQREINESYSYVPYAAGRVVVAVWLPQADGSGDPVQETWSAKDVQDVHLKVLAALQTIREAMPNADLQVIPHFESAPPSGGVDGTVATRFEAAHHVDWGSPDEGEVFKDVYARIYGEELNPWEAHHRYLNELRQRYDATSAFVVLVAPTMSGQTPWVRAHAYFNGPYTVLHSNNAGSVFTHEFGHIFGAMDEYCPDQCRPPNLSAGYFGAPNANSTVLEPNGEGPYFGQGENRPSLMRENLESNINTFTRWAWGWMDLDQNGRIDVYDTRPNSSGLRAVIDAASGVVSLQGRVIDQPASPLFATPFSPNSIRKLAVRIDGQGDFVRLNLPSEQVRRGRSQVDLALGRFSAGTHAIEVRAINDQGIEESRAHSLSIEVPAELGESGGSLLSVEIAPTLVGPGGRAMLRAKTTPLDGVLRSVELDTDGDGDGDVVGPSAPVFASGLGAHQAGALIAGTSTRAAQTYYTSSLPAPVQGKVVANPTVAGGERGVHLQLEAHSLVDDNAGDDYEYRWTVERVGYGAKVIHAGDFVPGEQTLSLDVPNIVELGRERFNIQDLLTTSQNFLTVRDAIWLDERYAAIALGHAGIAIVDLHEPGRPQLAAQLGVEVSAASLLREGRYLYVLGSELTVVDVSNPLAPVERKQYFTHNGSLIAYGESPATVSGKKGASIPFAAKRDSKIRSATVSFTLTHEQQQQFEFALRNEVTGESIVLGQGRNCGGTRTYSYNPINTPALASLAGQFSGQPYSLEVRPRSEGLADGTVTDAKISFQTRAKAMPAISGARKLLGLRGADMLLVAGDGIQSVQVTHPQWLTELGKVSLSNVVDAEQSANGAIVLRSENDGGSVLSAVGFQTNPWVPSLIREVVPRGYFYALSTVGDRFYLAGSTLDDYQPTTLIGQTSALVSGQTFERGSLPTQLDHWFAGVGSSIWAIGNGDIVRYNNSNPNAPVVEESFDDLGWFWSVRASSPTRLMVSEGSFVSAFRLDETSYGLSSVVRARVDVRDADGAVSTFEHTIAALPYLQPIAVAGVTAQEFGWGNLNLTVDISLPQGEKSWNTNRAARFDLDRDGSWDTQWLASWNSTQISASVPVDGSGTLDGIVEVRDGYFSTAQSSFHVEYEVPEDCSGQGCPDGLVCRFCLGGPTCVGPDVWCLN